MLYRANSTRTNLQRAQLLVNGRAQRERIRVDGEALDFEPAVKLFTPHAGATWLLTELDPYYLFARGTVRVHWYLLCATSSSSVTRRRNYRNITKAVQANNGQEPPGDRT